MSGSYRDKARAVAISIAGLARQMAKEYDTKNPSYSPSFVAVAATRRRDPTAYVVADRHEMVNEFGWTDLAGKHHGGRFVFRRALRRHRKQ
jgi:hypothetical protein